MKRMTDMTANLNYGKTLNKPSIRKVATPGCGNFIFLHNIENIIVLQNNSYLTNADL